MVSVVEEERKRGNKAYGQWKGMTPYVVLFCGTACCVLLRAPRHSGQALLNIITCHPSARAIGDHLVSLSWESSMSIDEGTQSYPGLGVTPVLIF